MRRLRSCLAAVLLLLGACGDDGGSGRDLSEAPPAPTSTPTATSLPVVASLSVEADHQAVNGTIGGVVTVRAFTFDDRHQPLGGSNLIFDVSPRIGRLVPVATTTRSTEDQEGVAEVQLAVAAGTEPGIVTVTASVGELSAAASFEIIASGPARRAGRVDLGTSYPMCGTHSGGAIELRAIVVDSDGLPMNGASVLFLTPIGMVDPLAVMTTRVGNRDGVARTTLLLPCGTPILRDDRGNILPYELAARAGGVIGTAQIFMVPGRECGGFVNGGVGEPAALQMAASPTRLEASTSPARDATITVAVFDNRGNRLPGRRVRFSIEADSSAADAGLLPLTRSPLGTCAHDSLSSCELDHECGSELCVLSPLDRFTATTGVTGQAAIRVRVGTATGSVVVRAEVPSQLPDSSTVPCRLSRVMNVASSPERRWSMSRQARPRGSHWPSARAPRCSAMAAVWRPSLRFCWMPQAMSFVPGLEISPDA